MYTITDANNMYMYAFNGPDDPHSKKRASSNARFAYFVFSDIDA